MIATSAAIGERINQDFRKEQENKLNTNVESHKTEGMPLIHIVTHSKL
jgi:hypothetical protein